MLPERDIPVLERPSFFDGQLLSAVDLQAVERQARELRWLHNRTLHGWGIASGYEVQGERDSRTVTVMPGLALDCAGRELVLSDPITGSVPPLAGPVQLYLTVSYAEDDELAVETREGLCESSGVVRREERPNLRWIGPDEFLEGADIVLASAQVRDCKLANRVSTTPRQQLPQQLPYIGLGASEVGGTYWWPWPDPTDPSGVATTVGTGSAGFSRVPVYQAMVVGAREFDDAGTPSAVDGHIHLAKQTATSFELRMILPGPLVTSPGNRPLNPNAVRQPEFAERLVSELGWYVSWTGMEL
jgi:hypothetical protein